MKKLFIVSFMIGVLVVLSGCSYNAITEYYTEVSDYEDIWSLTEFRHGYGEGEVSDFFPKSIEELEVNDFFCRYDQVIPLSESVVVYLETYYEDAEVFVTEIEHIRQMGFECNEQFDDTDFLAYATKLGKDYDSEYALIDEKAQIIYYIYLGGMPEEEIELDEQFVPNGYYDWGEVDTDLSETE